MTNIHVRGIDYTPSQAEECVLAAVRLLSADAEADADNGGGESTKWESVDLAHEIALEAKPKGFNTTGLVDSPVSDLPEETGVFVMEIEGISFTHRQVHHAVHAAQLLIEGYEKGAGRGGSMDWEDIDAALEVAQESLSEEGRALINARARDANGFEGDEDDDDDDGSDDSLDFQDR